LFSAVDYHFAPASGGTSQIPYGGFYPDPTIGLPFPRPSDS